MAHRNRPLPSGPLLAATLAAAVLVAALCAPTRAVAQPLPPTGISSAQTTGTQTISATGGIDDKTYISSGSETAVSAFSDFSVHSSDILSVEGLVKLRASAAKAGQAPQIDVVEIQRAKSALKMKLDPYKGSAEEDTKYLLGKLPSVLNSFIAPGPADTMVFTKVNLPERSLLSLAEYQIRANRIKIGLLGDVTGLWKIRPSLINILLAGDPLERDRLIQFRGEAQIRRDITATLPPISLLSAGVAARVGHGAPLYTPDITYSSAIEGYDVTLQGIAGGASGAGFTFRKDLAPARNRTVRLLVELYRIVGTMPSKAQVEDQKKFKDICKLLHYIAEDYPRMQMAPRVAASISYRYLDFAPPGDGPQHYSVAAANISASWLRPVGPRGPNPASHSPVSGIGALAGVQQLLVAPNRAASSTSTRLGGALYWQDVVPYYDERPVPAPPDTNLLCPTGFRFDHWHMRVGAEASWDTRLQRDAAWDIFLKLRTLPAQRPATEAPRTVEDLIRGDMIFTFAVGRGFDRSDTATFRIDRAF